MIFEPVTGISFPPPDPGTCATIELGISILEAIANCTAIHLHRGGYLAGEHEKQEVLAAYRSHLAVSAPGAKENDFVLFLADYQALKHAIGRDGEIKRIHKILQRQIYERIHYWSLGNLSDPSHALYVQCPSVRVACELLVCPAICANDDIVHVAALNPFAGLVAAEWIRNDAGQIRFGEQPFVFLLMVEFAAWTTLHKRHFAL
ncbi:MAG: hypothetical protein O3C21_18100 [Verrucomicrobia bacterium]|nr:hypothetical protein [Verrucomicrobiota bacterium]